MVVTGAAPAEFSCEGSSSTRSNGSVLGSIVTSSAARRPPQPHEQAAGVHDRLAAQAFGDDLDAVGDARERDRIEQLQREQRLRV